MDQELRQAFTRRLSQCNRSELVVIIYEIYFASTEAARNKKSAGDHIGFKKSLRRAADCQSQLMQSLDLQYEVSYNLRQIYDYCRRLVFRALAENNIDYLQESDHLMGKLQKSFVEVAKNDDSAPLMQNAQTVYAGFTYGRGSLGTGALTENYEQTTNRGFLV